MDSILSKLKKVPTAIWMVILFASIFLRDLAYNLTLGHASMLAILEELTATLPELSSVFTTVLGTEWLWWILSAAFSLIIFEVVCAVLISLAQQRRALQVFRAEITQELHIFFVFATLVAAVLDAFVAVLPAAYGAYWNSLVEVLVYPAVYGVFYYFRGRNFIVYGWKAGIWKMVATLIGIFLLVPAVFDVIGLFQTAASVPDVVMTVLICAVSALDAFGLFRLVKIILKQEKDNPPPPPPEAPEEERPEVFKGFGF